jgi:hypothetical protein
MIKTDGGGETSTRASGLTDTQAGRLKHGWRDEHTQNTPLSPVKPSVSQEEMGKVACGKCMKTYCLPGDRNGSRGTTHRRRKYLRVTRPLETL